MRGEQAKIPPYTMGNRSSKQMTVEEEADAFMKNFRRMIHGHNPDPEKGTRTDLQAFDDWWKMMTEDAIQCKDNDSSGGKACT